MATPADDLSADRLRGLHRRGMALSRDAVAAVGEGPWDVPTPCDQWDLRQLVTHMTVENLWVPDLLAGATVAEVGDRFDGDVLGEDPVAAHDRAVIAAARAAEEPGATEGTVHLSYGDADAGFFLAQRFFDLVVHAWDVAVAIGGGIEVPDDLAQAAYDAVAPMLTPQVRAAGIFGPEIEVAADGDILTRLLALTGRDPDWSARR